MRILNEKLEKEINEGIVESFMQGEYDSAIGNIPGILIELHSNIPEKKRISYGIVYVVKVLSEHLYDCLVPRQAPIYGIATSIHIMGEHYKTRCVSLGILSFYGLERLDNFTKVLPYFEAAASHEHWEVREFAATFFQGFITRYPDEVKSYFLKLVESDNANIRRFVSETLRPIVNNKWFYKNPDYPLPILRKMFKESKAYPRTSVGNNLSDLARHLPDLVYGLVEEMVRSGDTNSYWIAYRACRNLVKKEPNKVMDLLRVDEYKYKDRLYKRSDYQGN